MVGVNANARSASPWLSTLARLVLAGVLGVAGALKVADPAASLTAVRAYQLLPEPLERVVGYGLPFFELGLAALLLLGLATRLAAVLAGLLMIGFVVGIASAWVRGLAIDCGCFGRGGAVAPEDTTYLPTILRDAGLVVVAAWLAWRPTSALSLDGGRAPTMQADDAPPSRIVDPVSGPREGDR